MLRVRERDDAVGVTLPEANRHADVGQRKAPMSREEHEIENRSLEVRASPAYEVVEEHRLHLGPTKHALVAFGRDRDVEVEQLRAQRQQTAHAEVHRAGRDAPYRIHDRRDATHEPDDATADGVGASRGRDAAEHRAGDHSIGEARGTRENVRTATGEADAREAVDTEAVGDRPDVAGPLLDVAIEMRRRVADAGALEHDEADAELFGDDACLRRDLPAPARRAVEPEHRESVGAAVFGETDAPLARQPVVPLQTRFR